MYLPNINWTTHELEELVSQPTFTCSKSTIETLEKGVEYNQS